MKIIYVKYWLILFLVIGVHQQSHSEIVEPVRVDSDFTRLSLNNYYALYSTPKSLSANKIYKVFREKYTDKNHPPEQDYSIKDFHWLFFTIKNTLPFEQELVIDFNNAHVDTIELFRITKGSNTPERIGFGGDKMPFFERKGINRRFIFEETVQANTVTGYLLKIDQRYSTVSYPLILWTKRSFLQAENLETIILSLYLGGLLFIALFSFITGYIVNQKLFMYYAFYTVMMGIFQSANLGLLFKHIYPYNPDLKNVFHVAMVPVILVSFIIFSIQFLRIRKKYKLLDAAVNIYYSLVIFYFVLMAIIYQPHYLIIFSYYAHLLIFLTVALVIIFSIISYRKGHKKIAKTYIAADLAMIIGGIVMVLDDSGFIPHYFVLSKAMIFGSMLELTIFTIAIIIGVRRLYDKKNELLQETANHRKMLLQASVKGRDEEGTRISRELHDNIGSQLALLKNRIILGNTNKTDLLDNVNELSKSIRKISHELAPFNTSITGLEQRLEQFLKEFSNNTGLKVNFYYSASAKFEDNIAQQIFRILQEATQNCLRHAKATELDVQIITHDKEISITIDDNGIGFDKSKQKNEGNGIQNMISRTESVNGKFEISSGKDTGTHILITIPLPLKKE